MATHQQAKTSVQATDKDVTLTVDEGKLLIQIGEGTVKLDGRTTHAVLNMLLIEREIIVKASLAEQRQDEHAKDRRRTKNDWI